MISHPAFWAWMAIPFLATGNVHALNPPACNEYAAYKTTAAPEDGIYFDGEATNDEEVWQNAVWHNIDQVWLPYHNLTEAELKQQYPDATREGSSRVITGPDDFSGRFKLAWNEEENLLYLLAEITDNVFVGGYIFSDKVSFNHSGYDVLEIFIDEDKSGGPFEQDLDDDNFATNAFAYHILTLPYGEDVTNYFYAIDMNGSKVLNFDCHIPYFSFKRVGNIGTYEMAMKLYRPFKDLSCSTGSERLPTDKESILEEGKKIGFSLAYCDNDKPTEFTRDHFIGSSFLPEGKNNSNFQTADNFGTLTLMGEAARKYNIDITDGTAMPETAEAGETVNIWALDFDCMCVLFDKWTGEDAGLLNDAHSSATTFTMPAKDVVLVANYTVIDIDNTKTAPLTVLPNPAGEVITLLLPNNYTDAEVNIVLTSMDGRELKQLYNGRAERELILPLSGINQGVYFIKVTAENESNIIKVIKN